MSDQSKTPHTIPTLHDLTLPDGTVNLDLLVSSVHRSRTELVGVLGMSRNMSLVAIKHMIYRIKRQFRTAKSAIYLGNAGLDMPPTDFNQIAFP